MAAFDLTTLDACKTWLGISDTASDKIITGEITRISSMVLAWLNGPAFIQKSRTEFYNGKGQVNLTLRNAPVLSVTALSINGKVVPPNITPPNGSGFTLEVWDGSVPAPLQSISLNGYWWGQGQQQNIQVTYVTGYVDTEVGTVDPTTFQYCPDQPQGLNVSDQGVTFANGTALVSVASNPQPGQYVPPNMLAGTAERNFYQFNAADAGAVINVTYSFVPWAVEMCARDLLAERFQYRNRIGLRSKTLGGQETMSYDINTVPKWAQQVLQPFQNVVPI